MVKTGTCILKIQKLRLMVHLGCTASERGVTQPVDLEVSLRFPQLPEGAQSDSLEGTICYDALSELLKKTVVGHHFNLLEKLSLDLFNALRKEVSSSVDIWIKTTKLHPPVTDLNGGVSFSLGDWSPSSRL